uniref:Uncharacterized protein n=1 Tax=Salmo trutta TaxID=8032 RepID=A0A673YHD5_SALTR
MHNHTQSILILSAGCCQHWSYDMSPGGKRQSGSCDGAYPMMGGIWSLFGCDVSPHAKIGLKNILKMYANTKNCSVITVLWWSFLVVYILRSVALK